MDRSQCLAPVDNFARKECRCRILPTCAISHNALRQARSERLHWPELSEPSEKQTEARAPQVATEGSFNLAKEPLSVLSGDSRESSCFPAPFETRRQCLPCRFCPRAASGDRTTIRRD